MVTWGSFGLFIGKPHFTLVDKVEISVETQFKIVMSQMACARYYTYTTKVASVLATSAGNPVSSQLQCFSVRSVLPKFDAFVEVRHTVSGAG